MKPETKQTQTTIRATSIMGRHGFKPCIYVYEDDRFLWRQTEPIYFVNDEDAIECARRMRMELLFQWVKNSTQEVA